jgi:hypothetical protein
VISRPPLTLPVLSVRVTRSSPAGLRQAQSWKYCLTASAMIEPRIRPGDYELTLRSRRPDGKQATSSQSVVVSYDAEFNTSALNSRAEMPANVTGTAAANPHPSGPPRGQSAGFAAVTLTDGQGARTIISNVRVAENSVRFAPCQVWVSFFGADGSLIGNATAVQLKAGESTSVPALRPSKLVRAVVSIGNNVDSAKVCALRTSVEIFDVQTGTTLVTVPGDSIGSDSERGAPPVGSLRLAPRARN